MESIIIALISAACVFACSPAQAHEAPCKLVRLSLKIHSGSATSPWTSPDALKSYFTTRLRQLGSCPEFVDDDAQASPADLLVSISTNYRLDNAKDPVHEDGYNLNSICSKSVGNGMLQLPEGPNAGPAAYTSIVRLAHGFALMSAKNKPHCAIRYAERDYCLATSLAALKKIGNSYDELVLAWEASDMVPPDDLIIGDMNQQWRRSLAADPNFSIDNLSMCSAWKITSYNSVSGTVYRDELAQSLAECIETSNSKGAESADKRIEGMTSTDLCLTVPAPILTEWSRLHPVKQ